MDTLGWPGGGWEAGRAGLGVPGREAGPEAVVCAQDSVSGPAASVCTQPRCRTGGGAPGRWVLGAQPWVRCLVDTADLTDLTSNLPVGVLSVASPAPLPCFM